MTYGYIYQISFPNDKVYIGLTNSLKRRRSQHKYCVKNGDTKPLYNALRKYEMEDTFELEEIDTSDNKEELSEKEKKYISEYKSHYIDGNGYNMTYGGDGFNGHCPTREVKQKILDIKGQNKLFDVFTKDGTLLGTFNYQFEAVEYLLKEHNIKSRLRIGNVLKGKQKSSHGFVFKYTYERMFSSCRVQTAETGN